MRTITTRLVGGLGNQLHCYAMGRAVAANNNAKLIIDAESGYWCDPYGRRYMLGYFSGLRGRAKRFVKFPFYRTLFRVKLKAATVLSEVLPLSHKLVIKEGPRQFYQANVLHAHYKWNPYFIGYWSCHQYYAGLPCDLRRELTPPRPQTAEALALLGEIETVESCMVHWRSYVEDVTFHHPDLKEYYSEAIRTIAARHRDVRFFVFSDRPDLIDNVLGVAGSNITLVNLSSMTGEGRSLAEFYLMYRCKHAIIGDSTFSWWAAWLGDWPGKSVVAPGGLSPWGPDWTPPAWTVVEVRRRCERIAEAV